jgi:hypothetical protein
MLTPEFKKQIAKLITDAWKNGLSEAEALDKAGLLLHPAKKVELVSTAFRDVAELLRNTPAQQIVPAGVPLTAGDIVRHVGDFLDGIAQANEDRLKEKR